MSGPPSDFETLTRAFAARSSSREVLNECPNPELLFEAASGALEREQCLRIVDHVSQCGECSQAWRVAMELGARPTVKIQAGTWTARALALPRFAMAASLILAVGIAAYVSMPRHEPVPQYRDVASPLAPRSLVASKLPRDRFLLRWSAGPQGSTYTVRLSTADLVPLLLKQDLTTAELLVPPKVLAGVASGDPLLWQVEVRLPNGQRVESNTYAVTVD
jgi:hypothetical protein